MMELHLRIPEFLGDIISSFYDIYRGVLSVELIGYKRDIFSVTEEEESDFSTDSCYLEMEDRTDSLLEMLVFERIVEDIEYLRRDKNTLLIQTVDLYLEESELFSMFLRR